MEEKKEKKQYFRNVLTKESSNFSSLGITVFMHEELPRWYKVKVIEDDGVACVSVTGWNCYSPHCKHEPKGKIYGPFKARRYKRYRILKKLGLWENGRILPRERNQTSLDLL